MHQRGRQTSLCQRGGMHAVCELAQVTTGRVQIRFERLDRLAVGRREGRTSLCEQSRDVVESPLRA